MKEIHYNDTHKSISIYEDDHRRLVRLKISSRAKNLGDVINMLIKNYKGGAR